MNKRFYLEKKSATDLFAWVRCHSVSLGIPSSALSAQHKLKELQQAYNVRLLFFEGSIWRINDSS